MTDTMTALGTCPACGSTTIGSDAVITGICLWNQPLRDCTECRACGACACVPGTKAAV
ncbi:hypothetical protein JVX90_00225 [Gordonia sp. PDNC005]|uniref:hypothetical protein n=1 Tax=Gordonia sp. PDNC005 TaxID=2811424 RepID=UPI00196498B9|nr:hypothetical protein [Gordonia sp. PDNC005]QRY62738.1 hypothetical protein JVX90_00225 [Gordonia sp. PDNC005]